MYLIGHGAIGAAIITATGIVNPVAAFGVGWLSHYLADAFPHGDEPVGEWAKRGAEAWRIAAIAGIDAALLGLILLGLFAARGFSWMIFLAVAGSALPDVMWGLEKALHCRLFGPHERIHKRIHNFLGIRLSLTVGIIAAVAILSDRPQGYIQRVALGVLGFALFG